jgi:hypothetical protein
MINDADRPPWAVLVVIHGYKCINLRSMVVSGLLVLLGRLKCSVPWFRRYRLSIVRRTFKYCEDNWSFDTAER